jgi:hypothetical protein
MPNKLEQLNITYDPVQDRMLLKINTGESGEYRIWLTRRYTEILANLLVEMMEKEGGIQNIASHHDTINQLKGGAFDKEYALAPDFHEGKQPMKVLPLGAEGILGYRINFGREPSGNIKLELLPEHGQGVNLSLNRTLLFMMYNMMEQGAGQANWNIHFPQQHKDPVH